MRVLLITELSTNEPFLIPISSIQKIGALTLDGKTHAELTLLPASADPDKKIERILALESFDEIAARLRDEPAEE